MKVAIYLSGIPSKSKNQQKKQALLDFAQGVQCMGDEAILVQGHSAIDCDIAVIQGWVNSKAGAHLKVRSDAIDHQRQQNKHIVVIDSNLFGFLEPTDFNRYLRYSLDGIFPTTGYYFNQDIDHNRWNSIKKNYGWVERPWRDQGNNILICLQRNGGWSMGSQDVLQWLDQSIRAIRQYSDRPIVIRPHPGNLETAKQIIFHKKWKQAKISIESDIRNDLSQAWATVTYNSSPGVASLLWGVPVWVTDPDPYKSQAYPWAETRFDQIESPTLFDRSEFYHRLSQCHFSSAELCNGEAWRFMRQRLPNTPRQ